MEQPEPKLSDVLAKERTSLAVQRTVMAADRSLMAWVRTGLSLIGFGITLFKFLQYMQKQGVELTMTAEGPRRLGLFLISLGTASVILGSVERWKALKAIPKEYGYPLWRFSLVVAFLLALLGLFLLVSIITKVAFL